MTAAERSSPRVEGLVEKSAAERPNPRYMARPPRRAVGRLWIRRSPGAATAPRRKASQRAGRTAMAVKTRATKNGQTAGPKRAGEKVDQKVGSLKKVVPSSTAGEIVRTAPGSGRAPVRAPFGRRDRPATRRPSRQSDSSPPDPCRAS